jgi:hypothetical protein
MSVPPIVALGLLQVLRNIGILSRKGERMPWFRGCAKGTALEHQTVRTEVQLDRVRQFRQERVDDKQQVSALSLPGMMSDNQQAARGM